VSEQPVIIEVALNGGTGPARNRTVPTSVDEIVAQGHECIDLGATIVHNHLVTHALPFEETVEQYAHCFRSWLARDPNLLPMPTIASGQGVEGKLGHLDALGARGVLEIGFIDPGSLNLGWAEPDGTPRGFPYINTYDEMTWAIEQAQRNGFALHFAIFEPGFLRNVFSYWRLGRCTPGTFVKFYFGGDNGYMARGTGVSFGLPPTVKALDAYLEMLQLEGCDLPWFSAVPGGDLLATPVARATLEQGGHLRVGLEDHFGPDQPSNAELVAAAVALCAAVGRPVATPRQAREILGMRVHD
jgi:3-keto-5-aminohexanoate cleavage enzyme